MKKKRKPGRPKGSVKNVLVHQVMKEFGVSRQWAYQLLKSDDDYRKRRRGRKY